MISREISKQDRQTEIRTNRLVTVSVDRGCVCACVRIPTGFCPRAQGCATGATLGQRPTDFTNRNAVATIPVWSLSQVCHNPVGVDAGLFLFTQGSCATLGWRTQSRWDCLNCLKAERRFLYSAFP